MEMNNKSKEILDVVKAGYKSLDDKFGKDIVVLYIGEISSLADYFIIATGKNPSQLSAMADAVEESMNLAGGNLIHREGTRSKSWVLLDYGSIIVHIFNEEDRNFYNIERIWGDAQKIDMSKTANSFN